MIRTNNSIVTGRVRSRRIISAVVTVNSDPDGVLDGGPGDMALDTTNNWLYVKTTDLGTLTGWEFLAGEQDTGWRVWPVEEAEFEVDDPAFPSPLSGTLEFRHLWRRLGRFTWFGFLMRLPDGWPSPDPTVKEAVDQPLAGLGVWANYPDTLPPGGPYLSTLVSSGNTLASLTWHIPFDGSLATSPVLDLSFVDGYNMNSGDWYFASSPAILTPDDFPSSFPGLTGVYGGQSIDPYSL